MMGSLWPRSGTIERYADDIRAAGAKAFFYQGGTTSPITVYGDSGDNESLSFPVLADAQGRWPDIFIPYSVAGYDVQVKTADNVQLTYTISIPNPNPIAVTPPPATDGLQTGMIHGEFVNATKAGFVRLNGRTVGNAISGATERAHADTANLFAYLWNNLGNAIAPVSGGRSGTAAADFAANRTIQLVNMQGSAMIGLDDMGSSAAGLFAAQSFAVGHSAIIAGSACGSNTRTITISNLPSHGHTASAIAAASHDHGGVTIDESSHTHSGTTGGDIENVVRNVIGSTDAGTGTHTHGVSFSSAALGGNAVSPTSSSAVITQTGITTGTGNHSHTFTGTTTGSYAAHHHNFTTSSADAHHHTINADGGHTHTITVDPIGSGTAVDNIGNSRLVTWFIKL